MTYEFTAALVRSLGGRVREVRLDRVVEGASGGRRLIPLRLRCSGALLLQAR